MPRAEPPLPVVTPEEACAREGLSAAACAARDAEESARRTLSAKTCTRLFPEQEVMQTACISSCRSFTTGDGQDCAFNFSRSLREVTVEKQSHDTVYWFTGLFAALLCAVGWAVFSARRKSRAGRSPD